MVFDYNFRSVKTFWLQLIHKPLSFTFWSIWTDDLLAIKLEHCSHGPNSHCHIYHRIRFGFGILTYTINLDFVYMRVK